MKSSIFAFIMFCAFGAQGQSIDLRLASDVWPPFTNTEGEKAFASALVLQALQRSNISSQTDIIEFGDVITGITHEQFDGSAALWYSEDRENYLLYSDPYLENRLVLVGAKGSDVSASTFDDLAKKKVGIVENYAYGKELTDAKSVRFREGPSDQANLDLLLQGELDYILVDQLLIQHLLLSQKKEADEALAIGEQPLLIKPLYFAIRKEMPKADYIMQQFNKNIAAMQKDGSYHQILELNWIRVDMDGDGRLELVHRGGNGMSEPMAQTYSLSQDMGMAKNNNKQQNADRFYVDGRMYDSWDTVPDQYKQPDVTEADLNRPGLSMLRINF